MRKEVLAFFTGFIVAVLLIVVTSKLLPSGAIYQYHEAIDLCEAQLPRDQICEIHAQPEKDNG